MDGGGAIEFIGNAPRPMGEGRVKVGKWVGLSTHTINSKLITKNSKLNYESVARMRNYIDQSFMETEWVSSI